jgi:hypothetical protein
LNRLVAVFKDTAGASDPANLPILRGDNDQPACEPSAAVQSALYQAARPGILVDVLSVLPRIAEASQLGQDRMDNLMKAHS